MKHNLRQMAMPFDWSKSNIKMICEILENNFSNFFENIKTQEQSDNFNKSDDSALNLSENIKSRIKIRLSNGIVLPHESTETDFNYDDYKDKYQRRIDRFNNIVRDDKIKKIFIRSDDKKIKEENKYRLNDILQKYGCKNYEIIYINYSDYESVNFTWQREYIPWNNLFNKL